MREQRPIVFVDEDAFAELLAEIAANAETSQQSKQPTT
jgi:hypothetical protein